MLLEDGAVIVALLAHWCVLWEAVSGIGEHKVRHVLVSVVTEGVDPAIADSIRELVCVREIVDG